MIGQRQRGSSLVPVLMLMELSWLQWTSISSINHFHKIFGMNPALWKESVSCVHTRFSKIQQQQVLQRCITRHTKRGCYIWIIVFFSWHPRASSVQRGRLVINMSLVPSQDKALLALNPSALMKKRLTAHTEKLVLSATQRPSHTHTQTYTLTISCQNESDLCGLVSQDRWQPSAQHNVV